MNVVIVESAAKAKIIQKYLNEIPELRKFGKFSVIASFGHICDLPPKELGIDKTRWTATYVPLEAKKAIIAKLRKEIDKADTVWIASDLDMEGEAIANHIRRVFALPRAKYHRITFNEITKPALRDAVLHPRNINGNMVDAQEARRILDRVIGYEISPLLWRRFATARLSAGRVQSAALKMIVEREKESKTHTPEPIWTMHGEFDLGSPKITLIAKVVDSTWDDVATVKKRLRSISKTTNKWTATFAKKESKRGPSAPFTTSSLQQEAYSRLGLPAKRTMQIAQSLYESGRITYMRTDSPALSEMAQASIATYIREHIGDTYVHPRQFKARAANAQEAHECIRPTSFEDGNASELRGIDRKLYDLIWRRTVASQMIPATYHEVQYTISCTNIDEVFKGQYDVLVEEGYLKVYNPDAKASKHELDKWQDVLNKGHALVEPKTFECRGDVSRPPALFNEPMLIRALEKVGIGRPSTYTTIIEKLFSKGYVIKGINPHTQTVHVTHFKKRARDGDIEEVQETIVVGGSETDKFVSTSLGERVIDYMDDVVPSLLDPKFTAKMEATMDEISDGKHSKSEVLNEFYGPFSKVISAAAKVKPRKKKDDAAEPQPIAPAEKNVLREFPRLGTKLIQTKYGPALFKAATSHWVSLLPFLKWRKKTIEELTERDVKFLMSLPMKMPNGYDIVMGRYGLYVKDSSGNNMRLVRTAWDDVYNGRMPSASDVVILEKKTKSS